MIIESKSEYGLIEECLLKLLNDNREPINYELRRSLARALNKFDENISLYRQIEQLEAEVEELRMELAR